MANLDRQLYIIINTVNGYIEPGIQNTSIPKLYSLAGARRSLSHKKRWAEEQAKEKGESIVRDNWKIFPITVEVSKDSIE